MGHWDLVCFLHLQKLAYSSLRPMLKSNPVSPFRISSPQNTAQVGVETRAFSRPLSPISFSSSSSGRACVFLGIHVVNAGLDAVLPHAAYGVLQHGIWLWRIVRWAAALIW